MYTAIDPGPGYRPASFEEEAFDQEWSRLEARIAELDRLKDKIDGHPHLASDFWRGVFNSLDEQSYQLSRELDLMDDLGPDEYC